MNDVFEAIQNNDIEKLRSLIEVDPEAAYVVADSGVSALMVCIYFQRQEMIDLLSKHLTKLSYYEACALGDAELVARRLDEDPAQIYENSVDGFSGVGLASFFGHELVVSLLIELGADIHKVSANGLAVAPINSAAAGGHIAIAGVLLDAGADPNARQAGGFTPLHSAAQNGDLAMAKLLIDYGADPMLTTDKDELPIDMLDQEKYPEIADLLAT